MGFKASDLAACSALLVSCASTNKSLHTACYILPSQQDVSAFETHSTLTARAAGAENLGGAVAANLIATRYAWPAAPHDIFLVARRTDYDSDDAHASQSPSLLISAGVQCLPEAQMLTWEHAVHPNRV